MGFLLSCEKTDNDPKGTIVEDFRVRYSGQYDCVVERYGYNSETGSETDYQFEDMINVQLHPDYDSTIFWQDKERTYQYVGVVNDTTIRGIDETFKFFKRSAPLKDSLLYTMFNVSPAYYDRTEYHCVRSSE